LIDPSFVINIKSPRLFFIIFFSFYPSQNKSKSGNSLVQLNEIILLIFSRKMSEENSPQRKVPQLNQRILSSLSRRSVAAHPWHDLEIGTDAIKNRLFTLY
jgi:hypothetical protein